MVAVVIYSLIYAFMFREKITSYTTAGNDTKARVTLLKSHRRIEKFLLRYVRALWFSSVIFVSPSFRRDYFAFSNPLQFVICTQWVIGVFMLAIFLVYIASGYAFVRSLIGL
jgi:hypothetical protein